MFMFTPKVMNLSSCKLSCEWSLASGKRDFILGDPGYIPDTKRPKLLKLPLDREVCTLKSTFELFIFCTV